MRQRKGPKSRVDEFQFVEFGPGKDLINIDYVTMVRKSFVQKGGSLEGVDGEATKDIWLIHIDLLNRKDALLFSYEKESMRDADYHRMMQMLNVEGYVPGN